MENLPDWAVSVIAVAEARSRERHATRARLQAPISSRLKGRLGKNKEAIQEYLRDHPHVVEAEQVVGIEQSESSTKRRKSRLFPTRQSRSKASASVMEYCLAPTAARSSEAMLEGHRSKQSKVRRSLIRVSVYGEQTQRGGTAPNKQSARNPRSRRDGAPGRARPRPGEGLQVVRCRRRIAIKTVSTQRRQQRDRTVRAPSRQSPENRGLRPSHLQTPPQSVPHH